MSAVVPEPLLFVHMKTVTRDATRELHMDIGANHMGCFTYLIGDFAQSHKSLHPLYSDGFCHTDQYNKGGIVYYIFEGTTGRSFLIMSISVPENRFYPSNHSKP